MRDLIAITGSRGMRSVGRIAVDYLIEKLQPSLIDKVVSPHFPITYETQPSYAADPDRPGRPGVQIQEKGAQLPRIEIYLCQQHMLLITRGYHADFRGQYSVAEQVLDAYERHGVRRLYVIAGYGIGKNEVCCAATSLRLVEEIRKYGIEPGYEGPFMGFSGLILGLAKLRGIEGICLFGRSEPNYEYPELPDLQTARRVLERLCRILNLSVDLSGLDNSTDQPEPAVVGW